MTTRNEAQRVLDRLNSGSSNSESAKARIDAIDREISELNAAIAEEERKIKALALFQDKVQQAKTEIAVFRQKIQPLLTEKASLNADASKVEWILLHLDETTGRALVLSKDLIAQKNYHDHSQPITWEQCTLRRWLNSEFLSGLPSEMKSRVIETEIINAPNPKSGVAGGNSTKDRGFLLSIDEANALFPSDESRKATYHGKTAWWWLRSPGHRSDHAAFVYTDGNLYLSGGGVGHVDGSGGVRPAVFLNLNS